MESVPEHNEILSGNRTLKIDVRKVDTRKEFYYLFCTPHMYAKKLWGKLCDDQAAGSDRSFSIVSGCIKDSGEGL